MKYAKYLKIKLSEEDKDTYVELCNLLQEFHGKCPVIIEYKSNNTSGKIPLTKEYGVSLNRELLETIEKNLGPGKYKIHY